MLELSSEVAALRRLKFFEELTDADLSKLARIGKRRSYGGRSSMDLISLELFGGG